jgi:hypothetical protein
VSFEHPKGESNRNKIIRAVRALGGSNVSWSQIKEHIEEEAKGTVKSRRLNQALVLDTKEEERRIKELCMSDEALSQNLKKLLEKRVLEKNKDGLYSFTDKVLADVRHFAPGFGRSALSKLLYFPTGATIAHPVPTTAEGLRHFIERFGMLLIFILIEGSRKVMDDTMKPEEKDKFAMEWVKNAVPLERMFDVFLSVYGPKEMRYYDGSEPSCEIPDQTLDMLRRGLKQQNPEIYKELLDVFAAYMGQPKERSLRKNSNKPGYFIYPRD